MLAHADNREDTEAEDEGNALLVDDVDCEGDFDVDTELLDDGDKVFDIELLVD